MIPNNKTNMEIVKIALLLEVIGFFIVSILLAVYNSRDQATQLLKPFGVPIAILAKKSGAFIARKDEYFNKGFLSALRYTFMGYFQTFLIAPILLIILGIITSPVWFVIGAEKLLKGHDNLKIVLASLGTLLLFTGFIIEFFNF